ncbi:MAG: SpvB/TcaC N-terminal domain-containing protein, partial [Myxococcales bacterium]
MHSTFRRSIGARFTATAMILVFGLSTPLTALAAVTKPRQAGTLVGTPFVPPGYLTQSKGQLQSVAVDSFADLESVESGAQQDGTQPLVAPVVPIAARVLGGTVTDAWAAFDGNARTQLSSVRGETTRIELEFDETASIGELTLQGPARGKLQVLVHTDWGLKPQPGLTDVAVNVGRGQVTRHSASEPINGRRLVLEWAPEDSSGPVEIGFWSYRSGTRVYQEALLADQIIAGTLPGALATAASPASGSVGGAESADFQFVVQQSPRAIARAFLVYELVGASHWTGVRRSINGGDPQGGFAPRWGKGGGIQVEEVAPSWLRAGVNHVRFERTPGPTAAIRNLRLITVANGGVLASSTQPRELGEKLTPGTLKRAFHFDTPSQPHFLTFQLNAPGHGRLELSSASQLRPSKLNIELDGLGVGWHRYPLDQLLTPVESLAVEHVAGAKATASAGRHQPAKLDGVTDVTIAASRIVGDAGPRLTVSYPLHGECVDGKAYVRGFVVGQGDRPDVSLRGATALESAVGRDGSYAFVVQPQHDAKKAWSLQVQAKLDSGRVLSQNVPIAPCVETKLASSTLPVVDEGAPFGEWIYPDKPTTLSYAGVTLKVPAGAVTDATRITVRPLVREQVTSMNRAMVNVTPGGRAYRFGPHGLKFKKPIAIELPYEKVAVPPGYQEGNIASYYFDDGRSEWVKVGRLDAPKDGRLASVTDHFTDFVNATIAMPDNPGTKSFNPNELKGMKLASPSAGVSLIQPPEPNAHGSANLEYPLEVPPGRNNVQPSLSVTYNSQADSTWVGTGWDLDLSRISIDTRFGVPRYDGGEEFTLDGQKIVPVSPGSNLYRRRVEGAFDRIERVQNGAGDYWIVTSKSGTSFYYGETANARLADPVNAAHVFEWRLQRVTDQFNNEMSVAYTHDSGQLGSQPFDFLYPQRIDYTTNVTAGVASSYSVAFVLDSNLPNDQWRKDVKIDGRAGFLTVQRHRLDHVDVQFDNSLIRRYKFNYKQGDFQKSLLQAVALQGRTGEELYRHEFAYFDGQQTGTDANGTPIYDLFDAATVWGTAKNGPSSPRSEFGMVRNEGNLKGISGELGIGIGPISITAGGGGNDGDDKTILRTLDLNGDGLPDFLDQGGRASANLLARPTGDHFDFLYPQRIDYTTNVTAGVASSYSVAF